MREGIVYRFEAIDEELRYVPLAARRVLDASGRKLALEGWLSLSVERRGQVVVAGAAHSVTPDAGVLVDEAVPRPTLQASLSEPDDAHVPSAVRAALGPGRPLDDSRWASLRSLDRYALAKCAGKPEKLAKAYDEIVGSAVLSHLTVRGEARMVDVGAKPATVRRAAATARVRTTPQVVELVVGGGIAKGDVLAVARVAGLLAVKRTPELIPLCHPVQTTRASVDFDADAARGELRVRVVVEALDRTGVEMEAMVAAAVASLTVYDMIKSADRWASVDAVRLEAKSGGKSGDVERPPDRGGG
ncbi:MAG TPA: cyclic pyranopterin monophosphate synthase MoaC [Polyangiaceae bacterium]|nr:cyclic pyranopterin monophosphate synthase MoaC [Polyangiaceae bacterium]